MTRFVVCLRHYTPDTREIPSRSDRKSTLAKWDYLRCFTSVAGFDLEHHHKDRNYDTLQGSTYVVLSSPVTRTCCSCHFLCRSKMLSRRGIAVSRRFPRSPPENVLEHRALYMLSEPHCAGKPLSSEHCRQHSPTTVPTEMDTSRKGFFVSRARLTVLAGARQITTHHQAHCNAGSQKHSLLAHY